MTPGGTGTSEKETKLKDIAHPDLGNRLERACDGNPDVPPLNHGRLGWFVEQLEKHDVHVAAETVRKWFAGETRPRHRAMVALAKILKIDEGWLTSGKAAEFSEVQRKTHNVVSSGAANLVAGFIQVDGGHPSFPGEDDSEAKANRIDLYAIIRGAHYRFHISALLGDEAGYFPVPHEARNTIVLGVVAGPGFQARIYELDWELIDKGSTRQGAGYEVRLTDGPFREIKSFAARL